MTSLDLNSDLIVDFVQCTSVKLYKDGVQVFDFPYAILEVSNCDFKQTSPTRDVRGLLSAIDASRCKLFATVYLKEAAKHN